ncbi:hypothetical protein FCL47_08345 [Desulfopila sp. IMCC35006]|uniref:hypothetical protein n=1 Tax=Desulfopila sp. IMCC35006 TaxID=2569542 RepID=UPI0010AD44ED|nr:hypothetical protein [Desulfopila sp. IMCC35006]TKB27177.1 hypothetical protein FCL47_08345 [Desulfopila sp. IMCC35006]
MKYIPFVTVLLWIVIVLGYIFARDIFLLPMIKFPALLLLSILLPVSFWTLQADGQRVYSFVFIGIFIFNIAILTYGLCSNYANLSSFEQYSGKKIDPEFARLLVAGNSEKERHIAGRIIYQKTGVALPFLTHDNMFTLYSPTQQDKDLFIDNHERNYLILLAKQNLSNQIVTTFFLLALQISIFFLLLVFLILYDKPTPPVLVQLAHQN